MERFELRLPTSQREQLDELGRETGLSSADLARIGIAWMLKRREVVLTGGMTVSPANRGRENRRGGKCRARLPSFPLHTEFPPQSYKELIENGWQSPKRQLPARSGMYPPTNPPPPRPRSNTTPPP